MSFARSISQPTLISHRLQLSVPKLYLVVLVLLVLFALLVETLLSRTGWPVTLPWYH